MGAGEINRSKQKNVLIFISAATTTTTRGRRRQVKENERVKKGEQCRVRELESDEEKILMILNEKKC